MLLWYPREAFGQPPRSGLPVPAVGVVAFSQLGRWASLDWSFPDRLPSLSILGLLLSLYLSRGERATPDWSPAAEQGTLLRGRPFPATCDARRGSHDDIGCV